VHRHSYAISVSQISLHLLCDHHSSSLYTIVLRPPDYHQENHFLDKLFKYGESPGCSTRWVGLLQIQSRPLRSLNTNLKSSSFSSPLITLIAGLNRKYLCAHAAILSNLDILKASVDGNWKDGQEGTVILEGWDEEKSPS